MTEEVWVEVPDFPGYAVSNHGRLINMDTDLIKTPTPNQQGIASVLMMKDGWQCRRSLTVIVAHAFLPPPPKGREHFNTPINKDGDRLNNHVDNLDWRPRWFAKRYHSQYRQSIPYGFDAAVEWIKTGDVFETVRHCAMTFGLLEKEIILCIDNHTPVFPTYQSFQIARYEDIDIYSGRKHAL